MALPENEANRLERVWDEHRRINQQVTRLVEGAIQTVTQDFKARFQMEVFQARHVRELLERNEDWTSLNVGQGAFYQAVRSLGWVRAILRFRGPKPRRIKVWLKKAKS